jgi:hypothetical protein
LRISTKNVDLKSFPYNKIDLCTISFTSLFRVCASKVIEFLLRLLFRALQKDIRSRYNEAPVAADQLAKKEKGVINT